MNKTLKDNIINIPIYDEKYWTYLFKYYYDEF